MSERPGRAARSLETFVATAAAILLSVTVVQATYFLSTGRSHKEKDPQEGWQTTCYQGVLYFVREGFIVTPVLDPRTLSPTRCERLPLEKAE